jgi:hypothetical protein
MVKLQDSLCEFALMVSPRTDDNVTITPATVGTTDTQKFPKERLLGIYNQARTVLQSAILNVAIRGISVSENVIDSTVAFVAGVGTKPSGCQRALFLLDSSKNIIPIVPVTEYDWVYNKESSTNRFVIESGNYLKSVNGNTYLANGDYTLKNVNVPQYTLSDVVDAGKYESFSENWHWVIRQIGEAIAKNVAQKELNALSQALVQQVITGA